MIQCSFSPDPFRNLAASRANVRHLHKACWRAPPPSPGCQRCALRLFGGRSDQAVSRSRRLTPYAVVLSLSDHTIDAGRFFFSLDSRRTIPRIFSTTTAHRAGLQGTGGGAIQQAMCKTLYVCPACYFLKTVPLSSCCISERQINRINVIFIRILTHMPYRPFITAPKPLLDDERSQCDSG